MKQERLVKSRSKKLGTILTVGSLLMGNFLSPVAILAQGSLDIQMEEGDFVHHPEDIVLPDLGRLDDLKIPEVERGQVELSDIEEPNPTNQIEVQVGTFEELQRVINEAVPNTALVINITNNFEFEDVIVIDGKVITIQSESDYTLTQRNGRHFMVQSNSLLTLRDGVILDGDSQAGGIEVHHATFAMRGGHITNNTSSVAGGGVFVSHGRLDIESGSLVNNESFAGGAIYISNGHIQTGRGAFISQNSAEYGGGIFLADDSTADTVATVEGNSAEYGGGMFITNSTDSTTVSIRGFFRDNNAKYGGGMFVTGSTVNLMNVGFNGNSAEYGGGLFLLKGKANCNVATFVSNHADYGGGMFLANDSTLHKRGGVIQSSSATIAGGGAYVINHSRMTVDGASINSNNAVTGGGVYIGLAGDLEIGNTSIIGNQAFQGGGVRVGDLATFTMRNSIIARNTAVIHCAVLLHPNGTFNLESGDVSC